MTDLRQGVTAARHRLLDVLDELEELGAPATAWADAATERLQGIVKHHHTPEEDDSLPSFTLPDRARQYAQIATDNLRGISERQDAPRARRALLKVIALAIAAVEQLDRTGRIGA